MSHVGDEKGENIEVRCIQLPNDKEIKSLKDGEIYKYLGVLEADEVMVKSVGNKVKYWKCFQGY